MIESIETTPSRGWRSLFDWSRRVLGLPWLPFLLAAIFIALDQFSGPFIQFPATFVIPVALAAWYGKRSHAILLAVGQPALNLLVTMILHTGTPDAPPTLIAVNALIRTVVLAILAYFISRTSSQNRELARRVGLLRGEIPVCFGCHKAQDEGRSWLPLEVYVARHTEAKFSEALCPTCAREKYGVDGRPS